MSKPQEAQVLMSLPVGTARDVLRAGVMALRCVPTNLPATARERAALLAGHCRVGSAFQCGSLSMCAQILSTNKDRQISMGLHDRDWYQKALTEREKQRKLDDTRAKFSVFSRKHLGAKTVSPTKTGFIPMMIFWCVVMGLLYMLMTHYLKPKPLVVTASGDLIIPRARDGHFYARGEVNGKPVSFLVDTGASMVTVSEQFARGAGLSGGALTVFKTANGDMPGRIVSDIPVTVGPVGVSGVRVGVGFVGHEVGDALLGQSFLAKFEVLLEKDRMTLRKR